MELTTYVIHDVPGLLVHASFFEAHHMCSSSSRKRAKLVSKNSISVGSESILGSGVARLNMDFLRRVIECLLYLVVPCCTLLYQQAKRCQDFVIFWGNKCSGHFWARKQVTESCMSFYFLLAESPCMTPMHIAIKVSRTRIGRCHLFARPANVLEDLGFDAGAANGSRSVYSLMARSTKNTGNHETIQTHNPFCFGKGTASNPKQAKTLGCLNQHDKNS